MLKKEKGTEKYWEAKNKDLRLIGLGLGSFVDIAEIYYRYYRKVNIDVDDPEQLSRHAIIHCATSKFNSEIDTIKLLTFIDLSLELEPAFKILLKED
ncbi:MAG: hypothetical protein GWO07_10885 [Candidatus Dadabacteria bacterium]|nr:hypothetical protein [Candidatus Dadabacteria bacterium]NIV41893.1 hypothetical protein [Candidatus Dadabacteria bacterium]